jgi:hypothetical protein
MRILGIDYPDASGALEPLKVDVKKSDLTAPPKSGGLISAMYLYRQLLTAGEKGFVGEFSHGGREPFYLPPPGAARPNYDALRVMTEVLRTRHAGVSAKWYFSLKDQHLLGFEVWVDRDDDPCEVFLSDYKKVDGRMLPQRIQVRHGTEAYADFNNVEYNLNK